jgi:predicted pyridoxine 5'-phosphate oxidase superfamily flavin-nucleotide-binding protein
MITAAMKSMIENNALAVATISADHTPHCIAVGYVQVINSTQLLLTNNYMRRTPENIKRMPAVACAFWSPDWKNKCEGYELIGSAEYFTTGPWMDKIKSIPENEGEPCRGAIIITVTEIKNLG